MKFLILLLLVIGCTRVERKINTIDTGNGRLVFLFEGTYPPSGSLNKLMLHALTVCRKFEIVSQLGADKYGDTKGIDVKCERRQ